MLTEHDVSRDGGAWAQHARTNSIMSSDDGEVAVPIFLTKYFLANKNGPPNEQNKNEKDDESELEN